MQDGFLFKPQEVPISTIYEGGVWALYYWLEGEVFVEPQYRRFMKGTQRCLFRMEINKGEVVHISSMVRYFWFNVDPLAQSVVNRIIEKTGGAPGWKKGYSGEFLFPLIFTLNGGLINIDYNAFVFTPVRFYRIGDK